MISIVIPTLNAEKTLMATLSALVPGVVDGAVREVIVVDGGSEDATAKIADASGARCMKAAGGRGGQLSAGGKAARGDWLLFLHADTVLQEGWHREAIAWIERAVMAGESGRAAAFRFALDDPGLKARFFETMVALRCHLFALPYGDQGLLISNRLYRQLGGYRELPLMEDVQFVRRIGRRRLHLLRSTALTSAVRYQREGFFRRALRNLTCLSLYFLRVPPRVILRIYG